MPWHPGPEWLLETRAHADHLSAAPYLRKWLGGTLVIGKDILIVQAAFGKIFNEGARFARDGSQFDLFGDGIGMAMPGVCVDAPKRTPPYLF